MTSRTRLTLLCAAALAAVVSAGPAWAQADTGAAGAPAAAQSAPVPGPAGGAAPPAAVEEEQDKPFGCPFKNEKIQLLV